MWFLAALLAASSPIASPAPVRAEVRRVISLAPTLSEIVCELGVCDRLVGVTRFDDYPPSLRAVTKVGGFVDPSLEAIVKLQPDLVLLTKNGANQGFVRALDQQRIAWLAFTDETLADFSAIAARLGDVLGRVKEAGALVDRFERELNELSALAKLQRSALVVYGHAPLIVAGPGSFAAELLARCGLNNAYRGDARYPTLDFETIAHLAPDLVIDVDMDGAGKSSPQYWAPAKAALRSTFVFAPDPALMRLGPRLPAAMRALRKKIDAALATK
jgi:iron complex transport system substrate-binding protein